MRTSPWRSSLIGLTALMLVSPSGASTAGTRINFPSLDSKHPSKISGTLYLPADASSPVPAVVLVHGTAGIDMRGELYREPILAARIGIFEVDFKTGVYSGVLDRPKGEAFLPMAFAALKELRKLPSIDPAHVGVMGFSLGGHVALQTALDSNVKAWMGEEPGFAAFAMFYPVCKPFIRELEKNTSRLSGRPMIIFYGTEDAYGEGTAVPELKSLLATRDHLQVATVEYVGAVHGFNRNAPPMRYFDPAANGRRGYMAWDPAAAKDSVTKVVAFLQENLARH